MRLSKPGTEVSPAMIEKLRAISGVTEICSGQKTKSLFILYNQLRAYGVVFTFLLKQKLIDEPPKSLKKWVLPATEEKPQAAEDKVYANPIPGYFFKETSPHARARGYSVISSLPYLYKGLRSLSQGRLDLDVLDAAEYAGRHCS